VETELAQSFSENELPEYIECAVEASKILDVINAGG
jgi:hypothetical protein